MNMRKFLLLILCLAFLPGNSLSELSLPPEKTVTPVILIPGVTRTLLGKGEKGPLVWGSTRSFFEVVPRDELALPIDSANLRENRDNIVVRGLMSKISLIPLFLELYTYKRFLKTIETTPGYQLGDIDHPKRGDNFFIFIYDWRRDNVEHAQLLAQKIEKLKTFFGQDNMRFDIVAHSNASYIARYYALYGEKDVLDEPNPKPTYAGAGNIRKLIMIGAPHRGTLFAFQILHEGFTPVRLPFVMNFSPYEAFTSPVFYELLPPSGEPVFVDPKGIPVKLDLYDYSNWIRYGWSVFSKKEEGRLRNRLKRQFRLTWKEEYLKEQRKRIRYLKAVLERADHFHRVLDEASKTLPGFLQAYSLVFTWGPTLARAEFGGTKKELRFRNSQGKPFCYDSGDLIVTTASMEGHYQESKPKEIRVHEKHRRMANSSTVHRLIMQILLSR